MNKKLTTIMIFTTAIILAGAIILSGCKKGGDIEIQIGGGEVAVLKVYGSTIQLFRDDLIIAQVTFGGDGHYLTTYGAGNIASMAKYENGKEWSSEVSRVVTRNGVEYFIVYDDEGRIMEEVQVDLDLP